MKRAKMQLRRLKRLKRLKPYLTMLLAAALCGGVVFLWMKEIPAPEKVIEQKLDPQRFLRAPQVHEPPAP